MNCKDACNRIFQFKEELNLFLSNLKTLCHMESIEYTKSDDENSIIISFKTSGTKAYINYNNIYKALTSVFKSRKINTLDMSIYFIIEKDNIIIKKPDDYEEKKYKDGIYLKLLVIKDDEIIDSGNIASLKDLTLNLVGKVCDGLTESVKDSFDVLIDMEK